MWEDGSRGLTTISYSDDPTIDRIFLTGFDPFLLDRNIDQSNPSGVTALLLDGVIFEFKGKKIQIETVMIPVRFDDFDQDLIERILTPLMAPEKKIDLITTISMGRKSFDLERFPGKRRSATISGNRNVITGASPVNPLIPLLKSKAHDGAEFVEFSLPVKLMQQATGVFKINDNHQVTTLANELLQHINSYMLCNLLHINLDKCCFIYFNPKREPANESESKNGNDNDIKTKDNSETDSKNEKFDIYIGSTKIKEVKVTKFLGVYI